MTEYGLQQEYRYSRYIWRMSRFRYIKVGDYGWLNRGSDFGARGNVRSRLDVAAG